VKDDANEPGRPLAPEPGRPDPALPRLTDPTGALVVDEVQAWSPYAVWELADRAAALKWLADNPPLQPAEVFSEPLFDSPNKKPGVSSPGN